MTTAHARAGDFSEATRRQITTRFDTPELLEALSHPDLHVRHLVAEIIVERRDAEAALDSALQQPDLATARTIGVAALDQSEDPDVILAKLWGSRIGSLRALALYRYQTSGAMSAVTASEAGLFDRSPSVRYFAQRYLANNGVDVRSRYVDALAADAVAVQGLAEIGGADDAELIEPFLADERVRTRRAAVLAIGRLLDSRSRSIMSRMLADPRPPVVRAAGRVLARQHLPVDELDDLWRRATDTNAPDALKRAVFVAFGQQGRWPKLVLACRAIGSADEDIHERGEQMLHSALSSWNRSATEPTPAQIDELRVAGPKAGEKVESRTTAQELVGLLKQYGVGHA